MFYRAPADPARRLQTLLDLEIAKFAINSSPMRNDEFDPKGFLDGKLLIAMPGIGDSRFDRSVIFMCAHSHEGAMGLIVNKPSPDLQFADLLAQLEIPVGDASQAIEVHIGGPVEHGRGFVLHSPDYQIEDSTLSVGPDFGMTATLDILKDLATGGGPSDCLLALGYSGWGPGQLEVELQNNGWLICDAKPDIVFGPQDDSKWAAALNSMGIDPRLLAAGGGQA